MAQGIRFTDGEEVIDSRSCSSHTYNRNEAQYATIHTMEVPNHPFEAEELQSPSFYVEIHSIPIDNRLSTLDISGMDDLASQEQMLLLRCK